MPNDKQFPTLFHNYVCPVPEVGGTHGGVRDGYDIPGGQKGTRGKLPEVTTVDVRSGPSVGEQIKPGSVGDILKPTTVRQPRRKMG